MIGGLEWWEILILIGITALAIFATRSYDKFVEERRERAKIEGVRG